jgi:2-dehydropantoate 2-reductase
MMPVDKLAPGSVACKGHGISYFGSASNESRLSMAKQIEDAFQQSGIQLQHEPNIDKRIWEKVGFNAGMNALCALSHGRPGCIEDSPGAKQLAKDTADEVAKIALAKQIDFDIGSVYDLIELSCTQHKDHIPSMLQDLYSQRRTEVDALNGAIASIGEQHGISAPLNQTLATLVRLAELSHQRYT